MSLKLFSDLLGLLLMLGATTFVLLGWGNLAWRFLSVEQPQRQSVVTVWLGFCIVVALVEIIHLAVPIDWVVTIAVAVIGVVGGALRSKVVTPPGLSTSGGFKCIVELMKRYPLPITLGLIVIVCWCLLAMQAPSMFDSGLYHFGSIRWLNEYAIVPGLGNLHWRLALNQSYFGFLALLNLAPYWGYGYAAGGLFLLVLTALTVIEVSIKQSMLWRWIFGGLLFSYLCLLSGQIANPLPDTAIALLQIAIFVLLYYSFAAATQTVPLVNASPLHIQIVLVLLCVTIVTTKLSSVGFAAASFAIVCVAVYRAMPSKLPYLVLVKLVGLVGIFTVIHIGRSYLLSGAPFFPSPFGGIWSLTWAVPFGVANNESQLIYAWAKKPGISLVSDVPAGFGWIGPWLAALPQTMKYLFAASSILLLFTLILRRIKAIGDAKNTWLMGIPIATSLVFWFFTAPDPRFLGAMVVLYFAWTLYLFSHSAANLVNRYGVSLIASGRTTVHVVVVAGMVVLFARWSLSGISTLQGWGSLPTAHRELRENPLGYKAFVPTAGTLCWDSELPCTFMLDDGLERKRLFELPSWSLIQPLRFSLSIRR